MLNGNIFHCCRWLAVRLESIGSLIIFTASLVATFQRNNLDAGLVGLALAYALNVSYSTIILFRPPRITFETVGS